MTNDTEDGRGNGQGGHGHDKQYDIVINGDPFTIDHDVVSYEDAVALAYPVPPSPDTRFTVTFFDAHKPKEGALKPGGSVEVKKDGTIFNVKPTITS